MKLIAETNRLILREFSALDAEGFYRLNLDPEVIRYTGDVPFDSVKEASDFIRAYTEYRQHGFGRWSVLDKVSGQYLGFCGLRRDPLSQSVDLGFRLRKSAWGKGIGYEAARASLKVGIEAYGVTDYVASAMACNLASIYLLEKLGFTLTDLQDADGQWLHFILAY